LTKFDDYGVLAEKYYVEAQFSVSKISAMLNISPITLQSWKKKGNWEKKRQLFLASQYSCYSALQELLVYLSKDALAKIKSGEVPESASLNFIAKMAEKLPKIKSLNESNLTSDVSSFDNQTEIAKLIDKKLMNE